MASTRITPHTDPTDILGHDVAYTVKGQSGPKAINGRWQVLKHMDLGPGYQGMGGLIATTNDGTTASFMPYDTTVIVDN